jgi:hypothetical protein
MPKAEPPRDVGLTDEIEHQELVHCVHRGVVRRPRRGRRQLRVEWVARHRRSFEHQASIPGHHGKLFAQGGCNCSRDADVGHRDLGHACARTWARERPGELLEVEGVATTLLVEDGRIGGVDRFAE